MVITLITKALNTRFQTWADNNDINKDVQAGYSKGFSAIDLFHIICSYVKIYF